MLDPLATIGDLSDRGITVPDGMDPVALLNSASSSVRDAAGVPISETTSTISLPVDDWCSFDLPGGPVTDVASVLVASVPVVGWEAFWGTVTLPVGWTECLPVMVTVTYTHGLPEVPADIVDLVCGMVSMAAAQNGSYGSAARSNSVHLGEYSEAFNHPAGTESQSPMDLPKAKRDELRARFGTSAVLIGSRR